MCKKGSELQHLWESSSRRGGSRSLATHRSSGYNGDVCLHTTHRIPGRMEVRCHGRNPLRKSHPLPKASLSQAHLSAPNHLLASLSKGTNCTHVLGLGSSWGEQAQVQSYRLTSFFLVETESHYEAEVGLELVAIPLPLPLSAGITGMSRHFWLGTLCFCRLGTDYAVLSCHFGSLSP